MARGVSRAQAVRQFSALTNNAYDAQRSADALVAAMAESREPLKKMGSVIGSGFVDTAGPALVSAAQSFARGAGPVGGVASSALGGAVSGGATGLAFGPVGAAVGAGLGGAAAAAGGAFSLLHGQVSAGQEGFLSAPAFSSAAQRERGRESAEESFGNRLGASLQGFGETLSRATGGFGFQAETAILKKVGGFLGGVEQEAARSDAQTERDTIQQSAAQRTAAFFSQYARVGGKVTREGVQGGLDFELKKSQADADVQKMAQNLVEGRYNVMKGLSPDHNALADKG